VSSVPDVVLFGTGFAKTLKAGRLVKPIRLFRLTRMVKLIRASECTGGSGVWVGRVVVVMVACGCGCG
jgi:hypothetical protein